MQPSANNKDALLLLPQHIGTRNAPIQLLRIKKANNQIVFDAHTLPTKEVLRLFGHLPKPATEALIEAAQTAMDALYRKIDNKLAALKSDNNNAHFTHAIVKEQYQIFENLLIYAELYKWYRKIWKRANTAQTAACTFNKQRPQLSFSIIAVDAQHFNVALNCHINGVQVSASDCTQHHFLLEYQSQMYLLKWKDCQTLHWLQQEQAAIVQYSPEMFKTKVLARLEADYTVHRNGYFEASMIDLPPVNRVMLSELSGSFLMLTPQWLYDGLLIEGNFVAEQEVNTKGELYKIKRNAEAEQGFKQLLQSLHPNFAKQSNGYYYLSFAEAQKKHWFLKTFHQLLELNIEVAGMDLLQHFRYSAHKCVTTTEIVDQNLYSVTLSFSLCFGEEQIGLQHIQKILLAGQRAVLLKDGSLGILTDEWLQKYGAIIKHGRIQKKHIEVARWMAIFEESATNNSDSSTLLQPSIDEDWWQRWRQWQHSNEVVIPVPSSIQATLRPYQQKGFEWMVLLSQLGAGACLADDMGLGKTLQTISLLAHLHVQQPSGVFIIITPASLVYNWQQELRKFAPHFTVTMYHDSQRNFDSFLQNPTHILITTYGTLRSDIEQLSTLVFDAAVVDESHNIKNPTALITRAIAQIHARTRIALSGTPVMNNTFDLYAQLSFLLPGMFGSREFFKKEYADPIDRERNADKIQALQKLTAPFILRRTKEQVATDLPDKVESILWCTMGTDQQAAYETIRDKVRNSVFLEIQEKGFGVGKLSVINGLLKLRQICNSCELVKDEDLFTYDSIKTELLTEELINLIPRHKALVFSQFTGMLSLLEKSFQKAGIAYLRLDGSTPIEQRQALVNRFQEADNPEKVFLISLKAGNAGLNLTAADYVFLFDPWWNTAVQQQAIDRTHRIGQTKQVFAYQLICKNTIEEKMMHLQQRKKMLASELISEDEGFIKSLTEEDISYLFS